MKNTKRCPKCNSQNIVRVPDNQNCHANRIFYIILRQIGDCIL